jgi:hypothetical protein
MEFLSNPTGENIWIASSDGDINRVTGKYPRFILALMILLLTKPFIVPELLTRGEDVNGHDEYGYTPM